MARLGLALGLAFAMAPLVPSPAAGQEAKPPARLIGVYTPNGWWLDINTDGSGRVGYGSSLSDAWGFKGGTFDADKVTKALKALANDKNGKMGSHFVFGFEAERQGPDRPGPARYTRDTKVIPSLYERAIEAGQVRQRDRGALLLEKYPPGLPKEK